jgi:hypothetical protein
MTFILLACSLPLLLADYTASASVLVSSVPVYLAELNWAESFTLSSPNPEYPHHVQSRSSLGVSRVHIHTITNFEIYLYLDLSILSSFFIAVFLKLWSTDHRLFVVLCKAVRKAVSGEKVLQNLYQTLTEWMIHPHMSVLKLCLLVAIQGKVGELLLSINSLLVLNHYLRN